MERKRSVGVTLFAVLILGIASLILCVFSSMLVPRIYDKTEQTLLQQIKDGPLHLPTITQQDLAVLAAKNIKNDAIRMTLYGIALFISGIAILLRKNWGRLLLILVLYIGFFSNIVGWLNLWIREKEAFNLTILPFFGLSFLIASITLYYLTRPKVKEQFK